MIKRVLICEDFLPVVDAVKGTGKRVYGAFFGLHESRELKETFDSFVVLNRGWFTTRALKGKATINEFNLNAISLTINISIRLEIVVANVTVNILIVNANGNEFSIDLFSLIKLGLSEILNFQLSIPQDIGRGLCKAILTIKDGKQPRHYLSTIMSTF